MECCDRETDYRLRLLEGAVHEKFKIPIEGIGISGLRPNR